MKDFYIEERCTQNWDDMPKTPNGTYCGQCSMEVYDFTNKSSEEIRAMLFQFRDKQLCTRMTKEQETKLNNDFEIWKTSTKKHMQRATFFTFLLVFGLTFISCNEIQDEKKLETFRQEALNIIDYQNVISENVELQNEITDPSNDIALPDVQEELIYEIIDTDVAEISFDTVVISKEDIASMPNRQYVLGGAVYSTVHYTDYLNEVVPEKEKQYDDKGREIPTEFNAVAFPNPSSGLTNLNLEIPEDSEINISVHNMTGQMIHDFKTRMYLPGTHELGFDLTDHPTGIYLVIIQSKNYKEIVRVSKL